MKRIRFTNLQTGWTHPTGHPVYKWTQ